MPKQIILVRHGETDYNKIRRMQGWLDIPLNPTGISQAIATSSKFKDINVDAIYSSDLIRALETAGHISKVVRKSIVSTLALRERDMGILSGWDWENEADPEKDKLWKRFVRARDGEDLDWDEHGGESMRQVKKRVSIFLDHLHTHHHDQVITVVTHGGTINSILEHFQLKSPTDGFKEIKNASLLVLRKSLDTYTLEEL